MTVDAPPSFDPRTFLPKVGKGASVVQYGKGQIVFSEGDPADAVFYLQNGRVKVSAASEDGKKVATIHGANACFGEGCLAGQEWRMWTVTTITDAAIIRLEKAAILRTIRTDPAFSEMLVVHLAGLIIHLKADLSDQILNSSEQRLVRLLLKMSDFGKNGLPTITNISQKTLADMIGTTRSRTSFFMNKFRKLGFVDYQSNGGINRSIEVHRSLLKAALR
jgi:CRP/FNR family cyclic AMP-dependent transcriptional regulator